MPHPLIYTAPYRLGPLVDDGLARRLCRSRDFLAASFDRPVRLEEAARHAYLSPYYFHRVFTQTFGETPLEFQTRLRIDRAKELLAADELPVTEVCLAVGYESLGSFSTRFRSAVGASPSQFQRTLRKTFAIPRLYRLQFIPHCFLLRYGSIA